MGLEKRDQRVWSTVPSKKGFQWEGQSKAKWETTMKTASLATSTNKKRGWNTTAFAVLLQCDVGAKRNK